MDGNQFDAVLRAFGTASSRRRAIGGLLGTLLGAGIMDAAARGKSGGKDRDSDRGGRGNGGKPGAEGPCGDGSRKDNICTKNSQCCTGICNTKLGKKNKDRKGRCRCVRKGGKCSADRNCCNGMMCANGVCGGGGCTSDSECTGTTDTCTNGVCTCGVAGPCSPGEACEQGSCGIPSGDPCVDGGAPCANPNAACTSYKSWIDRPGTFCLLPFESACTAKGQCDLDSCYRGQCVACSCEACATVDCSNPMVTSGGDLQAAIDAASSEAVITIGPGTYTGDFIVPPQRVLTLVGCRSGSDEVILKNASNRKRTIELATTSGQLDLIDITVSGDHDVPNAQYGGGVSVMGVLRLCARTHIFDNASTDSGAGVSVSGSITPGLFIATDHSRVEANIAYEADGGGVCMVNYTGGSIEKLAMVLGNEARAGSGGGIYLSNDSTLIIQHEATIKENHSTVAGGGLYTTPDPNLTTETIRLLIKDDASFVENTADSYGGGIGSDVNVSNYTGHDLIKIEGNAKFLRNTLVLRNQFRGGYYGGGNMQISGMNLRVMGSVRIEGGQAYAGGGISLYMGKTNLPMRSEVGENAVITGNTADSYAGGVFVYGNDTDPADVFEFVLSGNAVVEENTSKYGGGVGNQAAKVTVKDNARIRLNTATYVATDSNKTAGGGILLMSSADSWDLANGSVIDNTPNNCGYISSSYGSCPV